jgi:F-type H+-transporting ATPase subunit b
MAEPTAHTEVPGGKHAFPPFQSEHFPSQLIWLTISFVLLYVLMSKIALPRIGAILAERERVIGDEIKAAEAAKQKSDAAHAAYEKSLADARARAQGIASATRDEQAKQAEAVQKRLEDELHQKLAAAEQSIAVTRSAAMGNVRGIAAETASAIVERLIGQKPSDQAIAAALGDAAKS